MLARRQRSARNASSSAVTEATATRAHRCYRATPVMGLYRLYETRIFPHLLDVAMRPLERYRAPALAAASGHVLEIGLGTGLNLPHYPDGVARVTGVDPMVTVTPGLAKRLAAAPFPVERHALAADGDLPFGDATFDCIAVTWTLCTIPDAAAALREMRRVARRGAKLLFVEHGQSDDPQVARWQDRLNPIQRFVACGCSLNRPIDALVHRAGFELAALTRLEAPGLPRTHGHLYLGHAIAGAAETLLAPESDADATAPTSSRDGA